MVKSIEQRFLPTGSGKATRRKASLDNLYRTLGGKVKTVQERIRTGLNAADNVIQAVSGNIDFNSSVAVAGNSSRISSITRSRRLRSEDISLRILHYGEDIGEDEYDPKQHGGLSKRAYYDMTPSVRRSFDRTTRENDEGKKKEKPAPKNTGGSSEGDEWDSAAHGGLSKRQYYDLRPSQRSTYDTPVERNEESESEPAKKRGFWGTLFLGEEKPKEFHGTRGPKRRPEEEITKGTAQKRRSEDRARGIDIPKQKGGPPRTDTPSVENLRNWKSRDRKAAGIPPDPPGRPRKSEDEITKESAQVRRSRDKRRKEKQEQQLKTQAELDAEQEAIADAEAAQKDSDFWERYSESQEN